MNITSTAPQQAMRLPHMSLQQPFAPALASEGASAAAADQVTLGAMAPALEAAPDEPAHLGWKHALGVGFLAAASLCGAAAGYLAGGHAAAQAPTTVSAPAPQQAQPATPAAPTATASGAATQLKAQQKAQITQAATAAVTQAVSDAAGQLAQAHPNGSVNIQIRDINVVVVGFDDFIDATQNHAPSGPATPGDPAQPAAPSNDGGSEQIHRKIEIRQGNTVIKASEDLKPVPATPKAPAAKASRTAS